MSEDKLNKINQLKERYGVELIMDVHGCDISRFNKDDLSNFFVELCDLIEMKRFGEPMYWHDDSDEPHLAGISGVQFIETSNIVVHTLSMLENAYINIFSCKPFDEQVAIDFVKNYFSATDISSTFIDRK